MEWFNISELVSILSTKSIIVNHFFYLNFYPLQTRNWPIKALLLWLWLLLLVQWNNYFILFFLISLWHCYSCTCRLFMWLTLQLVFTGFKLPGVHRFTGCLHSANWSIWSNTQSPSSSFSSPNFSICNLSCSPMVTLLCSPQRGTL